MASSHDDDDDGVKVEVLGVKLLLDGTVDRTLHDRLFPTLPPAPSIATAGAFSKEVPIPTSTPPLCCRIYLPAASASELGQSAGKLPILLYFHGGGFVLTTAASAFWHEYCCKVASRIGAMVISVEYRLAPEHRLPAAFDDGLSALSWLLAQSKDLVAKDPWLDSYADFSRCFLMGHSAGATLVHHVALRAAAASNSDHFQFIRGLILCVPFFGGIERTSSEIVHGDTDDLITLERSDGLWALSLPEGADRSHPYCIFLPPDDPDLLKTMQWPPSLVVVGSLDPLRDRQIELVEFIQNSGHEVILKEYSHYGHLVMFPEVARQEDVEEAYTIMQQFLRKRLEVLN